MKNSVILMLIVSFIIFVRAGKVDALTLDSSSFGTAVYFDRDQPLSCCAGNGGAIALIQDGMRISSDVQSDLGATRQARAVATNSIFDLGIQVIDFPGGRNPTAGALGASGFTAIGLAEGSFTRWHSRN